MALYNVVINAMCFYCLFKIEMSFLSSGVIKGNKTMILINPYRDNFLNNYNSLWLDTTIRIFCGNSVSVNRLSVVYTFLIKKIFYILTVFYYFFSLIRKS